MSAHNLFLEHQLQDPSQKTSQKTPHVQTLKKISTHDLFPQVDRDQSKYITKEEALLHPRAFIEYLRMPGEAPEGDLHGNPSIGQTRKRWV